MSEYAPNMSTKTEGVKKNIIESLDILERKAEKRGYLKGKDEAFEEAYQRGLNEAWEAVKWLWSHSFEMFNVCVIDVLYKHTPSEIIEVMRSSEKAEELHVGDEVIDPNGLKAIVLNTDTHYHLIYPHNGKTWKCPKDTELTKTGKRLEVGFSRVATDLICDD